MEDPLVALLLIEASEQLGLMQINFALYEENLISKFLKVFEGLGCLPGSLFLKYSVFKEPHLNLLFLCLNLKLPLTVIMIVVLIKIIIPMTVLIQLISQCYHRIVNLALQNLLVLELLDLLPSIKTM